MKPDLFTIGPFAIHSYGVMIVIGIWAAYIITNYRVKKAGLPTDPVFNVGFVGIIGGMLGAKLLYIITDIKNIIADPALLLDIGNGFVVYGGIIGGLLAAYLYARHVKIDFFRYLDLAIPTIALAQGFGRIGCFLTGCCYGKTTDEWYGVTFTESFFAPVGVKVIPAQLIYSVLDFAHFFLLILLSRKIKGNGKISCLYLIFYSIGRFLLEYIRGDIERGNVGFFSTSQFISIFILLIGIVLYIVADKMSKRKLCN